MIRTEALWKSIEAWTVRTKTYADYQVEVFKLYPEASGQMYTNQELNSVTRHFARVGFPSAVDLGEYYSRFLPIFQYSTVYTRNRLGCGLPGHGYGVEIPDPRVTRDEP